MNEHALVRLTKTLARIAGIKKFKWLDEQFIIRDAMIFGDPDDLELIIKISLADVPPLPVCTCPKCEAARKSTPPRKSAALAYSILASGSHNGYVMDSSFYSEKNKSFTIKLRHPSSGKCATGDGPSMLMSCICAATHLLSQQTP